MEKVNKKDKIKITTGAIIREPGSTIKNKTFGWRAFKPVIDYNKCTKCMLCWLYCPDNAIDEKIKVDYDYCKGCGICAKECPVKAINMVEEEK